MKRNKNDTGVEDESPKRRSDFKLSSQISPQETTIDTASLSSDALHNMDDNESYTDIGSEISSVSTRSHESLNFIRGKALYNLAQEMNALVEDLQNLDNLSQHREGPVISGSVSDDDVGDLQRELRDADDAFGDLLFDWDGKSIVVVQAESQEGITDIPNLTTIEPTDLQSKQVEPNHSSLISLDSSSKKGPPDGATDSRLTGSHKPELEESDDFQPPALEQEHEIHLATVSLNECIEGIKEEESKNRSSKAAFRQLEEVLALVQEENRTLRTQMDQLQHIRTKEEEEYDRNMQEVEDKMLTLMKRLQDKQAKYYDAMKQARDERASLEQHIQTKEEQIQQLELAHQKKSKEEEYRRKKLEKALETVQRDLERVDSSTTEMVELDDASSSMDNSPAAHRSLTKRDADGWSATPSPNKRSSSGRSPLSEDQIPEALTINHVLHMCQSPPKVSRMSSRSFDTPPDMVHEIMVRNEKAVQVLAELKSKVQQKSSSKKKKADSSTRLDYGKAEPSLLVANVESLTGNHMELVSQLDQESELLNKQLSVQREIIARLETKHKTIMENSRQRYSIYESELSELKATYDEQLATFSKDNESLNSKLAHVTSAIYKMKARHQKEIANLKVERQEIEKELLMDKTSSEPKDLDRFKQENESLSRQLVQYNEALDNLRSGHEEEIKAHEANQTSLLQELKKLQSKYESAMGSFHRQKEILMKKLIEKERAISEIELAQESSLKARQEEKAKLEEQLQTLDERCAKMKKERSELLQAQKKKFELLSCHMKELKAMRDRERNAAETRIRELEEKLETLNPSNRMSPKDSRHDDSAFGNNFKSDYEVVAVEASDTSRTSCLDPMADEDDKVQNRAIGMLDHFKESLQSYVAIRRAMALLLFILVIFACIQHVQMQVRVHLEEKNSLSREIAALQSQVNEWKAQDAAKDVTNMELQDSLEQANLESLSYKKEALALENELHELQVRFQSLQKEHADHLEAYLEETSHEPLPRCFSSPTLALVASFEEQLKDRIQQNGVLVETDVPPVDRPVDQDSSCEEDPSSLEGESDPSVMLTESDWWVNSQATVIILSKAGLEAELFLVENLELLSRLELLQMQKLSEWVLSMNRGVSDIVGKLDENLSTLWSLDRTLRFRDQSTAFVQSAVTKLKNRLLPRHRRLIKSEEGIWLELGM